MKIFIFFGLTVFFFTLAESQVSATGDPAKGKALYAVCQACHGADGMGNKELNSPKIAGQEPWYLERQLKILKLESEVQIQKTGLECRCELWH